VHAEFVVAAWHVKSKHVFFWLHILQYQLAPCLLSLSARLTAICDRARLIAQCTRLQAAAIRGISSRRQRVHIEANTEGEQVDEHTNLPVNIHTLLDKEPGPLASPDEEASSRSVSAVFVIPLPICSFQS
jgi:hypothetical protein